MYVTINDAVVSVVGNTLNAGKSLSRFNTCHFTVRVDKENSSYIKDNEVITFYDDYGNKVFSGLTKEVVMSDVYEDGGIDYEITCSGNEHYVAKRTVVKSYQATLSGDIVRDILTSYLAEEGITEGTIEDGKTINIVTLNYVQANEAFDKLCELNAFYWYIDNDKKLNFRSHESFAAPFDCTFDTILRHTESVTVGNQDYRNIQYLVGGKDLTPEQTQYFKGDGSNTAFTLRYPPNSISDIAVSDDGVNFTSKTLGVKGQDTRADFYWADSDPVISMETSNPVDPENGTPIDLSATQTLRVTYVGLVDIIITRNSPSEIDRLKDLERSTGKFEHVEATDSRGLQNCLDDTDALLKIYATTGTKLTYQTFNNGLEPGMVQNVTLPNYDLNNAPFLITEIEGDEDDGMVLWTVTAIQGPIEEDWSKFFTKAHRGRIVDKLALGAANINVVQPVYSFSKTWTQAMQPSVFPTWIYPDSGLYPDNGVYPTLSKDNTYKYVAWFDAGGVELGRVPIIRQVRTATTILAIGYIGTDITGAIAAFGWFGGNATDTLGSGILLDKQNMSLTKSNLEIYQVEHNDLKGW